jgi:hypothetical protein
MCSFVPTDMLRAALKRVTQPRAHIAGGLNSGLDQGVGA